MSNKFEQTLPTWAQQAIRDTKRQSLRTLDLSNWPSEKGEPLDSFPMLACDLTWLEGIYLSGNRIEKIPEEIAQLNELRVLNLSRNLLSDIPDAITQLPHLEWLHLNNNQITTVPASLVELQRLETLYLHNNPIETPPPEVLDLKGAEPVNIANLRAYYRQLTEEGEDHLYEAKLLIIGEAGAGKTSLAKKLLDQNAPLPLPEESTDGIDVRTWVFPHKSTVVDGNYSDLEASVFPIQFRVNVWDFGGQEIYHATHQFFLTRRSVYALVADAREQKTDFYYWLHLVEHLSDASPIIIIINEKQDRSWTVDERQLRGHFIGLKEIRASNLATNRGLERVKNDLHHYLSNLPHVGDVLPKTWIRVRQVLEQDSRPTMPLVEYLSLCQEQGFTNHEDKLQLSSYLHDLGVCLHFYDDALLKHLLILKPEWGTDAVYHLLDNEQIKTNLGHFTRRDVAHIWHENTYAPFHDELLALMMKFQLCYELPEQLGKYIAPQLLSEQAPIYDWDETRNLYLRYRYEGFMPKGIITRFIVALHPFIEEQKLVWRSGVVLEMEESRAEVIEYYNHREIRIRVSRRHKRDFLTIIAHELDKLHASFHRLKFDKLIPCNCQTCRRSVAPHFYRLENLKWRIANKRNEVECDKSFQVVNVYSLIDDVGARVNIGQDDDLQPSLDLPSLLHQLNGTFDEEEFRSLCFEFRMRFDNLPGDSLFGKQRELLLLLERNGRLPELITLLRQKRPNTNW